MLCLPNRSVAPDGRLTLSRSRRFWILFLSLQVKVNNKCIIAHLIPCHFAGSHTISRRCNSGRARERAIPQSRNAHNGRFKTKQNTRFYLSKLMILHRNQKRRDEVIELRNSVRTMTSPKASSLGEGSSSLPIHSELPNTSRTGIQWFIY